MIAMPWTTPFTSTGDWSVLELPPGYWYAAPVTNPPDLPSTAAGYRFVGDLTDSGWQRITHLTAAGRVVAGNQIQVTGAAAEYVGQRFRHDPIVDASLRDADWDPPPPLKAALAYESLDHTLRLRLPQVSRSAYQSAGCVTLRYEPPKGGERGDALTLWKTSPAKAREAPDRAGLQIPALDPAAPARERNGPVAGKVRKVGRRWVTIDLRTRAVKVRRTDLSDGIGLWPLKWVTLGPTVPRKPARLNPADQFNPADRLTDRDPVAVVMWTAPDGGWWIAPHGTDPPGRLPYGTDPPGPEWIPVRRVDRAGPA